MAMLGSADEYEAQMLGALERLDSTLEDDNRYFVAGLRHTRDFYLEIDRADAAAPFAERYDAVTATEASGP